MDCDYYHNHPAIMKRTSEKKEDYNKANPYLHV